MPPPLRTFGIDVGITGLRLVGLGLDSAGQPSLQNFASVETAAVAGVEPYPVLLEAMTKLAAQSGSKGREVRLCLGGSSVFSRILKVPTADRERMQALIILGQPVLRRKQTLSVEQNLLFLQQNHNLDILLVV